MKRPMIFSQKIKSADFYLPGRGNRILFKNELLLFQFRFKPKISSRKRFPSDSSKIRPKISPRKKRFGNPTLSQRKIMKKPHNLLLKAITVMNQTLEEYMSRFWKKKILAKVY